MTLTRLQLLPVRERFALHVGPTNERGCQLWTATHDGDGYGLFTVKPKNYRAHRWLYAEIHGPIPDGMLVCHSCDTPSCVNIAHLFLGTAADNSRDMVRKNRQASGESHGARLHPETVRRGEANKGGGKLTEGVVREIRARYIRGKVRQVDLAAEYGVTQILISLIVRGAIWQHLQEVAA